MSPVRPPPAPHFPTVIRRIEQRGITRTVIARRLQVTRSTVHRWAHGEATPRYGNGSALVFLAGGDPAAPEDPPSAVR